MPGFEPGIFSLQGRRVNHCATQAMLVSHTLSIGRHSFSLQSNINICAFCFQYVMLTAAIDAKIKLHYYSKGTFPSLSHFILGHDARDNMPNFTTWWECRTIVGQRRW